MTRDDEAKAMTKTLLDDGGTCIVMGCDNRMPPSSGSLVCPSCQERLQSGGRVDRVVRTMGGRRE